MSSVCIQSCVNDSRDPRIPIRASYVNLYKWSEPDVEFIKSVRRVSQGMHGGSDRHQPRVVDSISCRQMYLRSYTFSRKETVPEKTKKCFGKMKEKMVTSQYYCAGGGEKSKKRPSRSASSIDHRNEIGTKGRRLHNRRRKCLVLRKVKEISCNSLFRIFSRLLSCAASVDVVDHV